tara:strand:+ start:669 stop:884 length:216 start_codon:yes stop_codon:yes gene_type:complete
MSKRTFDNITTSIETNPDDDGDPELGHPIIEDRHDDDLANPATRRGPLARIVMTPSSERRRGRKLILALGL